VAFEPARGVAAAALAAGSTAADPDDVDVFDVLAAAADGSVPTVVRSGVCRSVAGTLACADEDCGARAAAIIAAAFGGAFTLELTCAVTGGAACRGRWIAITITAIAQAMKTKKPQLLGRGMRSARSSVGGVVTGAA
jgi:hypothetical protein